MVRDWPRDTFSRPHHHQYFPERYPGDSIDDVRFLDTHDIHRRQPPMGIDEALRQHCSIAAKNYFVAVIMDDGSPMTFSGPGARLDDEVVKQFFDLEKYRKVMDRLESGLNPQFDQLSFENRPTKPSAGFSRNRVADRRRMSSFEDWDNNTRQGRKRPRARHQASHDDDVPMVVSVTKRSIKIGNSDDVWNFYEQRFKNCQQTACKLIAKAWVKAVEPKKQSTHPYTGSDEKAPEWWPKAWGPTKEDKVRHKEPDHLYKRERVYLLNHILRMIVEPNQTQHPDIQKLNLNVKKLEEITTEALSGFFADKENPANGKKRPYLNEIFKVARQEERFKNGEIDGTTDVYVMAEDKIPDSYQSDNEDGPGGKEDEDTDVSPTKLATVQPLITTPVTTTAPAAAPVVQSPSTSFHGGQFLNDLPVRGSQYPPPLLQDMPAPEPHTYMESSNMPVNGPPAVHAPTSGIALDMGVAPASHDSSRRASLFSAPGDYAGQTGNTLYTQTWQPGSTATNSNSMYTFSSGSPFMSHVPMNQSQSYMGSFDSLSRPYDPGQAPMFRPEAVPQPTVHATPNYSYLSHDGRGPPDIKVDPANRNAMH